MSKKKDKGIRPITPEEAQEMFPDDEEDKPITEEEEIEAREKAAQEAEEDPNKPLNPHERTETYKKLRGGLRKITRHLNLREQDIAAVVRDKENCGWTGPRVQEYEEGAREIYEALEFLGDDTNVDEYR